MSVEADMSVIVGTHIEVQFVRVVDGDTIRVLLPNAVEEESLRILALDTEESYAGGSKPVTPWGYAAKERARDFFDGAVTITIEFPGQEYLETCLKKYRGNYGRLLVFVHYQGVDFQETMISEGFSPYFTKYGNADFLTHHQRYQQAEMVAQSRNIGVWNQQAVNGAERRNYAALGTWWQLRAQIIHDYRVLPQRGAEVFNSRLDYLLLMDKARAQKTVTVFTELRWIMRVSQNAGLIKIGSNQQPFGLFIADIESSTGQQLVRLLETRYLSSGDNLRRSYAFVTGRLSLYRDTPTMSLSSVNQISDSFDQANAPAVVKIAALLPNPEGKDRGKEQVTLSNSGATNVDLRGWVLQDSSGQQIVLDGRLDSGKNFKLVLNPQQMVLNNTGDTVRLVDPNGIIQDTVSYTTKDVTQGMEVEFS